MSVELDGAVMEIKIPVYKQDGETKFEPGDRFLYVAARTAVLMYVSPPTDNKVIACTYVRTYVRFQVTLPGADCNPTTRGKTND